jgi:hypothetical protein
MFKVFISCVVSLGLIFQVTPATVPAFAATCKTSGGQSGTLKHSGQTNGTSAKVCGNEIWKLLGKPKVVKKPTKPRKPVSWKNEFTVTPDKPKIAPLNTTDISVGEVIEFSAIAVGHTRNRMLLWYPAQVKFTPQSSTWDLGDGSSANGFKVSHEFSSVGEYQVKLKVFYSVKYRIIGRSVWVNLPGGVTAFSRPVSIRVGDKPPPPNGSVSLVHWNCIQKPLALGC